MAAQNANSQRFWGGYDSRYSGDDFPHREGRLRAAALEALFNAIGAEDEDVQIDVEEGLVILTGWVKSMQIKKDAQLAIETLPGVWDVVNLIKVQEFSQKDGRELLRS